MDILEIIALNLWNVIACIIGSAIGGFVAYSIAKSLINSDRKVTMDICFLQLELKSLDELDDTVRSVSMTLRKQERVLSTQVQQPSELLAFVKQIGNSNTDIQFDEILKLLKDHSKVEYSNKELGVCLENFKQRKVDVNNRYLYDGEASVEEAIQLKMHLQEAYSDVLKVLPKVRDSIALRRSDIKFIYGW